MTVLGLSVALALQSAVAQEVAPAAVEASTVTPDLQPDPDPIRTALSVNALGPTLSLVATALGAAAASGDSLPFSIWAADLNLRGHHMFTPRIGLTAQVDYTAVNFLTRFSHVGVRVGPRFSLREEWLPGWGVSPYLIGGGSFATAGPVKLSRWGVLGVGAEATRTWVRGEHFSLELGFGVYRTTNFGYTTLVEGFVGGELPPNLLPVKPQAIVGVGYAF